MIQFDRYTLSNGLRVIVHTDTSTPLACINILYDVGARDEDPERTGFAHLFEHLMFGGSINIPSYDEPLQRVGGENNAFTSNDITNYYLTLPSSNLETGFWLESDRMLSLAFSEKSLEVQRSVVIEEFKQRYLNQPYGDVWLLLRPLAYKVHPYLWCTIGKEIKHIEEAVMEDVKAFFHKHYTPSNAILVVAGNIDPVQVKQLAEKWFAPIASAPRPPRNLTAEPEQTEYRQLHVKRDVPSSALYMAFHMCDRRDAAYQTMDLISDLLSRGNSSRLYNQLVKEKQLFSEVNAYLMGDIDKGLFMVSGKLSSGVTFEQAEKAVFDELQKLCLETVNDTELQKVKNKMESTFLFGELNVLDKAMNLAYFELLGDAGDINREVSKYMAVTPQRIQEAARKVLRKENCSSLYYEAQ
ncbi:MAG TPA: pitrilysin family protein [Bacteroidia bacterium]|jgi:zinc protease|nr:pitrilysin family protein [Bacteroidia bacterium]